MSARARIIALASLVVPACVQSTEWRVNPTGTGDTEAAQTTTAGETTSPGTGGEGRTTSSESAASGESMTSSEGTTADPAACAGHDQCDEALPICREGRCIACTDAPAAACGDRDAAAPVCADGRCVVCTAGDDGACANGQPLCNPASNACTRPCAAHAECPAAPPEDEGAGCELFEGTRPCFPSGPVLHVDGDGDRDFNTIADALPKLGNVGTIILHELAGGNSYGPVIIQGSRKVAVLVARGEAPWIQGSQGAAGLTVASGATVYVDGLHILDTQNGYGVYVDDARAWLDRCEIRGNRSGGILVRNSGHLMLRTSIVGQSQSAPGTHAIEVTDASAELLYVSAAARTQNQQTGHALLCTGASSISVRNSLLVSLGTQPEVNCAFATFTTSATEAQVQGGGNVTLVNMNVSWFQAFNQGDLRLTDDAPDLLRTAARWRMGDPTEDIEGASRSAEDDTPDVAGADLPP